MQEAIFIGIGLVSGIISGMGIGGGSVLIPILTIFMGLRQQVAQSINLIYFIPSSIIAVFTHARNKNIEKSVVFELILFGVVGSIIGSMIANQIDAEVLKKIFGVFLILTAINEFFKKS